MYSSSLTWLHLILRFSVAYRYGEKKFRTCSRPSAPNTSSPTTPLLISDTAKMVKRKLGALEKVEADLYVHFASRCARRSEVSVRDTNIFSLRSAGPICNTRFARIPSKSMKIFLAIRLCQIRTNVALRCSGLILKISALNTTNMNPTARSSWPRPRPLRIPVWFLFGISLTSSPMWPTAILTFWRTSRNSSLTCSCNTTWCWRLSCGRSWLEVWCFWRRRISLTPQRMLALLLVLCFCSNGLQPTAHSLPHPCRHT